MHFRRELIAKLKKEHEVILTLPFDEEQHEKPFQEMGVKCIDTPIERRDINPLTDLKLMRHYKQILKDERPDLVITYSIKPNVYAGLICGRMGIPFCANVQGLGTAFQKAGQAQFVILLYKMAFRKVRTVFFENEGNAEEFQKGILFRLISRNCSTVRESTWNDIHIIPIRKMIRYISSIWVGYG